MEITGEGESRTGTEGAIEGLLGVVLCEMTLPCTSYSQSSSQIAAVELKHFLTQEQEVLTLHTSVWVFGKMQEHFQCQGAWRAALA